MLHHTLCPKSSENYCELRLHVDFENRLLMPLGVAGIPFEESNCFDVLVYSRKRCRPDCTAAKCSNCRFKMLYKDCAIQPKGSGLPFSPHSEYLYCLKCHERPAAALLSLTPHEQDVEVKELGLLACWFATWFQRAKATSPDFDEGESGVPPLACSPNIITSHKDDQWKIPEEEPDGQDMKAAARGPCSVSQMLYDELKSEPIGQFGRNLAKEYLPNMCIIYQVRKERMVVTLPEPSQLKRNLEVLLCCRTENASQPLQAVNLRPGDAKASSDLIAVRDTPYTLMLKLPGQGQPLELLDLVTERKVLRVQESRLAPKFMNFLMERRADQRATFVLHITFDEKVIEVNKDFLGEFFLDVDSEKSTLVIGTVLSSQHKLYRVEKLIGRTVDDVAGFDQRILVFEGSVNPDTLFINEKIKMEKESDYLISVVDPVTNNVLPTSVLSFRRTSLYVKEIKGGDVRLHVTVQRDLQPTASAHNENNISTFAAHPSLFRFQRQSDGTFHCPMDRSLGRTLYRIMHTGVQNIRSGRSLTSGSNRTALRSGSQSSATTVATAAAATNAAVEAAEASTYSCSGGGSSSRYDDSGLGRNHSSFSECMDSSTAATMHQAGIGFHIDVNLTKLKARLLPPQSDSRTAASDDGNSCYLIMEEPRLGGKVRSVPYQLGQEFSVCRWCRYTVKVIEECSVSPLFSFYLTDRDVIEIKQSGLQPVDVTKSVAR